MCILFLRRRLFHITCKINYHGLRLGHVDRGVDLWPEGQSVIMIIKFLCVNALISISQCESALGWLLFRLLFVLSLPLYLLILYDLGFSFAKHPFCLHVFSFSRNQYILQQTIKERYCEVCVCFVLSESFLKKIQCFICCGLYWVITVSIGLLQSFVH